MRCAAGTGRFASLRIARIGLITPALTVAIQNAVERRDIGTATATLGFVRSLGGLIGVVIFQAIYAAVMESRLAAAGVSPADARSVTEQDGGSSNVPSAVIEAVQSSGADSFSAVILVATVFAVAGCVLVAFIRDFTLGGEGSSRD